MSSFFRRRSAAYAFHIRRQPAVLTPIPPAPSPTLPFVSWINTSRHASQLPPRQSTLKVGLLGGSFNPPHRGHLYISTMAKGRLGLDQLWWLVTPGNPLKSRQHLAPLSERLATAQTLCRVHPFIRITSIEEAFPTTYTVHTIARLKALFPHIQWVWIMGEDNWHQLPRWHRWHQLLQMIPIAVCPRKIAAPFPMSQALSHYTIRYVAPHDLASNKAPVWTRLTFPLHPASSTALRAEQGE